MTAAGDSLPPRDEGQSLTRFKTSGWLKLVFPLLAVALIAYFVFGVVSDFRLHKEENARDAHVTALRAEDMAEDFIGKYLNMLQSMAVLPAVKDRDTAKCNPFFRSLNERFQSIVNFAAVDSKGFFFCSGKPFDQLNPPNIKNLDFFKRLAGGEPHVVMQPHRGPISKEYVTGVVVALKTDTGLFDGEIGVSIKFSALTDRWKEMLEGTEYSLVVFDQQGLIHFASSGFTSLEGRRLGDAETFAQLSSEVSGTMLHGGVSYLFHTLDSKLTGLKITALVPAGMPVDVYVLEHKEKLVVFVTILILLGILGFLLRKEKFWVSSLAASEENYRQLFEAESDAVFLIDSESGRILQANTAATILYGYSLEELLTKKDTDLSAEPEETSKAAEATPPVANQIVTIPLRRHLKQDGTTFPVEITGRFFIRNRRLVHIVAIRDITERKRAEEALRTIVEATIGTSGQESLERIAEELCRWAGLDVAIVGELAGKRIVQTVAVTLDGKVVPNFTYTLRGTPCANVKESGPCLYAEGIQELFPKDTMLVDMGMVGYLGTPLRNKKGRVVGILCGLSRQPMSEPPMWQDVMSLLGAKAVEELERQKVEETILHAKNVAEAANRAKSEFLANMSHEIRTPLNGILGVLQMLQMSPLHDEQKENIKIAQVCSQNLLFVINDILDLSRVEAGKLGLALNQFDPTTLLNAVVELLRIQAKKKHINLCCTLDKDIPYALEGDSGRIRQILFNLIGNAVKFTEEGEVHVQMKAEPVEGEADQVNLLFFVSDTGIGIPQDKVETIFDPFTQVDGSNTRKYGGTGLGLSIVQRLISLMDGTVRIESEVGAGTTVHVQIPLKVLRSVVPSKKEIQSTPSPSVPNLSILLAEDDLSNQLVVSRILEKQGHTVTCVATGREALKAVDKQHFDIVLMDVQMPEMDGPEATREIRKDERFKDLPIIALTAHAMAGDREQFLEAGMDDYLSKPMDLEELKKVMARVLDRS